MRSYAAKARDAGRDSGNHTRTTGIAILKNGRVLTKLVEPVRAIRFLSCSWDVYVVENALKVVRKARTEIDLFNCAQDCSLSIPKF